RRARRVSQHGPRPVGPAIFQTWEQPLMARDNENSYKQPDHLPATGLHPRRAMPDIDFEAERDDERAKRRVQMKLQRRAKDTEPDAGGRDGANTHENVSVDGAASDIGTPLPGELRERFETSL